MFFFFFKYNFYSEDLRSRLDSMFRDKNSHIYLISEILSQVNFSLMPKYHYLKRLNRNNGKF